MFQKKNIFVLFTASASLLYLSGCGSSHVPESEGGYYHSGIYFGKDLSRYYQKGIVDGCTTAKGTYKKSHTRFNNNQDYNHGWFLGRNRCKHLLIIEEENWRDISE